MAQDSIKIPKEGDPDWLLFQAGIEEGKLQERRKALEFLRVRYEGADVYRNSDEGKAILLVTRELAAHLRGETVPNTTPRVGRPAEHLCKRCGHEPSWHTVSSRPKPDPCHKDGCDCPDYVINHA